MKKTPLSYGRLAAALIASGALIFSFAWFTPAFAQHRDDKREVPKKTQIQRIILVDEQGQRKEYDDINKLSPQEKEQLKSALRSHAQHKEQRAVNEEEQEDQEATTSFPYAPPAPPALPASSGTIPPIAPMPPMAATSIPPMPPVPPLDVDEIVSEAMAGVDWDEINAETRKAMRMARREAARAMKEVDWEKINGQIADAKKAARQAMDEVDWDVIKQAKEAHRQAMEAHKQALETRSKAIKTMRQNREKALERLEADPQRRSASLVARKTSDKVHQGLDALERDGLISRKGGYTMERKKGRLYINGEEQNEEVNNRYDRFFQHKEIKASGSASHESISITD